MSDLSVKPDQVDALAASVNDGASGIETQLTTLQGAQRVLLGAWTGEAAEAYRHSQDGWLQQMQTLARVAHAAADAAERAAAGYREADDAVGRAWSL